MNKTNKTTVRKFDEWPMGWPLGRVRVKFNKSVAANRNKPVPCPCCGRTTTVYERRPLPSEAEALAYFYEEMGKALRFAHLNKTMYQINQRVNRAAPGLICPNALVHFGLLEAHHKRSGVYAVTELGESWLHGEATCPAFVYFRDRKIVGTSCEQVTFLSVRGDKGFTWEEDIGLPEPDPTVIGFRREQAS